MRIVLALALVAVACGDDDSGDGTPLTVDQLANAYRSAACRYFVACGEFPDRATCLSANLPLITDGFTFNLDANLIAAVKAGRVQLDVARATACLATIGSLTCDATDRDGRMLYPMCRAYLHGTRAAGEPCFLREECISQQCSGGSTTDACIAGTCIGDTPPPVEPIAIGMPCTYSACVEGAFCDTNDTGTCVALRRAGELCTNHSECDFGLACVGDVPGSSSCKALPVLGEACPDRYCRDHGTYCATSGQCEPIGLPPAACTGEFRECAQAYPCDTSSGTCVRGSHLGEPCAQGTFIQCFDAGTICDSTSFTCIAPRPNGQPCSVDKMCASDHCDAALGECAAAPACF